MWSFLSSFIRDEAAVTSIEYALLGVLIAAVIVASVTQLGVDLLALYTYVGLAVATAAT